MMRFIMIPAVLVAVLAAPRHHALAATIELAGTGQFQVQSKGTLEPDARVYRSLDPPAAFLVFTAAFPRPVYVTTAPRSARLIDPKRVSQDSADPDLVRVDTSGSQEGFLSVRVDGPNLVVDRDGITMTLTASRPVLGDRTLEDITRVLPEYRRNATRYRPDPRALETLRGLQQPTELIVFFGSWCPHCERVMPRLVRVLQDVDSAAITVTFHGVPPGEVQDPLADEYRITGLPTAVVRRGGKELTRIVGDGWDAPESSLAAALAGKPAR